MNQKYVSDIPKGKSTEALSRIGGKRGRDWTIIAVQYVFTLFNLIYVSEDFHIMQSHLFYWQGAIKNAFKKMFFQRK